MSQRLSRDPASPRLGVKGLLHKAGRLKAALWQDPSPIRAELFGTERLEQHARGLAAGHLITAHPQKVYSLHKRLDHNAQVLKSAWRASAKEAAQGTEIVPAAKWLLDNYHLVDAQIREIRLDLPDDYYRLLPKLGGGALAGYPRVLAIAWDFVAHTDSHFDPDTLKAYLKAYQSVEPLTIGELWAVAITLRIVLIENLRRLADQMTLGRSRRREADELAVLASGTSAANAAAIRAMEGFERAPLSEVFAAQLARRLRDYDPQSNHLLHWLETRLQAQRTTIDTVVHHALDRLGRSNVSLRNVITAMRLISETDWAEVFEATSLVEAELMAHPDYAAMDFASRNLYRSAIEVLARGADLSEKDVALAALASSSIQSAKTAQEDLGWHLIGAGRNAFERSIGFRKAAGLWMRRSIGRGGLTGYLAVAGVLTFCLVVVAYATVGRDSSAMGLLWAVVMVLPFSSLALSLCAEGVRRTIRPTVLPGYDLRKGVPTEWRSVVVMPVLVTSRADMLERIAALEVHFLSGAAGDLTFILLTDMMDAQVENLPDDRMILSAAAEAIERLNAKYPQGPAGPRFLLLHRPRRYNASEGVWMGWERKRGKLHDLNRLLRGDRATDFQRPDGAEVWVPEAVRYVITLDADTRLPRDTAAQLVGKIAHPLNRAVFDPVKRRVVQGYGILQPHITPALPVDTKASLYHKATVGRGGMDSYAAANSDFWQDLFAEGSFTGKGIYDVDAVEAAMRGRIPQNSLLSHDLLEGILARAGLASDVALIEDFPQHHDTAARRMHRWTRGDWQLLRWLFSHDIPAIGRIKMADTMRRSLDTPMILAAVLVSWFLPQTALALLWVIATIAIPIFLPLFPNLWHKRHGLDGRSLFMRCLTEWSMAGLRLMMAVVLLVDTSYRNLDAILRTLWRLRVSRRHLLQWTTAAQISRQETTHVIGAVLFMTPSLLLGLGLSAVALLLVPPAFPFILPFAILWTTAPLIMAVMNHTPRATGQDRLDASEIQELRNIARTTWRYFEAFVTPEHNHLPPDNFQEIPAPLVAARSSPTNIGLYLLSTLAARDFGWITLHGMATRLEATLTTLERLEKHQGHLYNWYDTREAIVLEPAYVSTVDSGNLAAHLIAVANGCSSWADHPDRPLSGNGVKDTLSAALEIQTRIDPRGTDTLHEIARLLALHEDELTIWPSIMQLASIALGSLPRDAKHADLRFWIETLRAQASEHLRPAPPQEIRSRLQDLARRARALALAMDFAFLFVPERKLFSIGWSRPDNKLDSGCYDLLASEARLTSLIAIAKGDVPLRHWSRLGRPALAFGAGGALISWSGSMFEYLMPSLVLAEPEGSLLSQTNHKAVRGQQLYGAKLGLPWGVSESGFNARDLYMNYQYSAFGIPAFGLRRALPDDRVIAPYATGLAVMITPRAALRNFRRIAARGGRGEFGFYEALDFTPARVPEGESLAIVHSHMAHHQGMTLLAVANTLLEARMRRYFHAEPMIRATELLLHERPPRDIPAVLPAPVAGAAQDEPSPIEIQRLALIEGKISGPARCHLLSNGRYHVMISARGRGYSRWGDLSITRWQPDATTEQGGQRIWLRDLRTGHVIAAEGDGDAAAREAQFFEDKVQFRREDSVLSCVLDVLVSGEDDAEVRHLRIASSARRDRMVEITTYAELVLATAATDDAHPAFAKMFVQTEFLPEYGALIATRRPRHPDEPRIWAASFLVVDGGRASGISYETDRAAFIGRENDIIHAAAMSHSGRLAGALGTVLDPIFALRQRIHVSAGKTASIAVWMVVADTREGLLTLIDRHHDRNAAERAKTLAWTKAQVELRHLGVSTDTAALFQRLTAPLLILDRHFRAPRAQIAQAMGKQSALWPLGISGDLPIIVLRIRDEADLDQVATLLQAHEYWRSKGITVDLVILNEHPASYVQNLQLAIEAAIRRAQSHGGPLEADHARHIHPLRADVLPPEAAALLLAVGRVVLAAWRGALGEQVAAIEARIAADPPAPPPFMQYQPETPAAPSPVELEFFNGIGGFDQDGKEYVTWRRSTDCPPTPWINVIANDSFGFHVSTSGAGCIWADNSRENRLTPWSNDPVSDPISEVIYLRDQNSGAVISPTPRPLHGKGYYLTRHGFGYTTFTHQAEGLALELCQFVPLQDAVKLSRLRIENLTNKTRMLRIVSYAELVMGTDRKTNIAHVQSLQDAETKALFTTNPWNIAFPDRVVFMDMAGLQDGFTADRTGFLGREGSVSAPFGVISETGLDGETGAGLDPCQVLGGTITLDPHQSRTVVISMGQAPSPEAARALVTRLRAADIDQLLAEVQAHWQEILGTVQVKTPDRAMDILLNGWLLYQTLACRLLARSAFWQSSGAYGFRDQLQDGMALIMADPARVRSHLLRAASRQFEQGDVQHWWLPHSGQGIRSRISDDCVWLAHAVAHYIHATGDRAILDEDIPYLDGPALQPDQQEAFFPPAASGQTASLFEHCALALDRAVTLKGKLGLPLIGAGDWNDGMNRVGTEGLGESVWLGWFLVETLHSFARLTDSRDPERAKAWRAEADQIVQALEREAWDGAWYRRATFDSGSWIGSSQSEACRIDSIAQSWATLSSQADPSHARQALQSALETLVHHDPDLVLLFSPPFDGDKTGPDPGYLAAYPPGLRENGGQYSHAAMWLIFAQCKIGDGDGANQLFGLLNPIHHAQSEQDVHRYKVEPYVIAADVYSQGGLAGRGGWTWYTGSAAWMYRAGLEGILGITMHDGHLEVAPALPAAWSGFSAQLKIGRTSVVLDICQIAPHEDLSTPLTVTSLPLRIGLDGGQHRHSVIIRRRGPTLPQEK